MQGTMCVCKEIWDGGDENMSRILFQSSFRLCNNKKEGGCRSG